MCNSLWDQCTHLLHYLSVCVSILGTCETTIIIMMMMMIIHFIYRMLFKDLEDTLHKQIKCSSELKIENKEVNINSATNK